MLWRLHSRDVRGDPTQASRDRIYWCRRLCCGELHPNDLAGVIDSMSARAYRRAAERLRT